MKRIDSPNKGKEDRTAAIMLRQRSYAWNFPFPRSKWKQRRFLSENRRTAGAFLAAFASTGTTV